MKNVVLVTLFLFSSMFEDGLGAHDFGTYFYNQLGCTKIEGSPSQYNCPDYSKNDTCHFKNLVLQPGGRVSGELLKGSCHGECLCLAGGRLTCADDDCFQTIKPGCTHKYSLDSCCPVGSVCDSSIECKVNDQTFKEGQHIYPKDTCEVCICDKDFKKEAPFCRPINCVDQANYQFEIKLNGAPVFFKNQNCCPSTWTVDEGEKIIKMNPEVIPELKTFCKFGNRKVQLGYGFKKSVTPYGRTVSLTCECTLPPFVTCKEI